MLPKAKRLNTDLFLKVIEKGQTFNSPFLMLKVHFTNDLSHFAVSVPKKVAKFAVERNKLRRRVYSSIKSMSGKLKEGVYCILILKNNIGTLGFNRLTQEIEKVFVKSGIIK